MTKNELKEKINSNSFFSLDPEKDSARYSAEKAKLTELLAKYAYFDYFPEDGSLNLTEPPEEIGEVFIGAIKKLYDNFNKRDTTIIECFNMYFKSNIKYSNEKNKIKEKSVGFKLQITPIYGCIIQYCKKRGIDNLSLTSEDINNISSMKGDGKNFNIEKVKKTVKKIYDTQVLKIDYCYNEEDDDSNTVNIIDSKCAKEYMFDNEIDDSNIKKYIVLAEEVYNLQSENAKIFIPFCFTLTLLNNQCDRIIKSESIMDEKEHFVIQRDEILKHYSENILGAIDGIDSILINKQLISDYKKNKVLPEQKSFAEKLQISPAAISKGYKLFLSKVKEKIKSKLSLIEN